MTPEHMTPGDALIDHVAQNIEANLDILARRIEDKTQDGTPLRDCLAYYLRPFLRSVARLASRESPEPLNHETYARLRQFCVDQDLMDGYDWLALTRRNRP
jgi:hypothetical protein